MEFLSVNHNKHSQNIKKRFARRFQNFQGIMFDYRLWLLLTRARFAENELEISGTKASIKKTKEKRELIRNSNSWGPKASAKNN